jgi:hypothetical protein
LVNVGAAGTSARAVVTIEPPNSELRARIRNVLPIATLLAL